MKRLPLFLLLALLASGIEAEDLLPAGGARYRLEFMIRGSTISRLLFIFPLRVFYEASAAVDLTAVTQEDGSTCFSYAGVPRTVYVLRTLGFSGKTLALLTANAEASADGGGAPADGILSHWRSQAPQFDALVKTVKKFPHRLLATGPEPFAFMRDASGFYRHGRVGIEPRYRHYPAKTGIYFNVFPMLAEILKLLNHRYLPAAPGWGIGAALPAEWEGDNLDFSADLNQLAGLMEKVVRSLVTLKQKAPFRLRFRVTASSAAAYEICGEGYPDTALWKGFMIREVFRRVRLRPADRVLLSDEFWMGIRNAKGQGGFGYLQLQQVDAMEVRK